MCRIEELKKQLTAVDDIWLFLRTDGILLKMTGRYFVRVLERTGHSRMKCSFVSSDSLQSRQMTEGICL